jgi:UDP-N-acetylmuramoyl-L-alanyl-D-glutamate--2,6-diaminopimelate ligase
MAILKDILYKASITSSSGNTGIEVDSIEFDSRKVKPGTVFVAVRGTQVDGHDFISKAVELGAKAIVCEKLPDFLAEGVTFIEVKDSAFALGVMAANFYGNPSSKLKLVAVTGTNGKTTTVTLLFRLFRKLGYNVGLLSTVTNRINDNEIPSTHTTPDPVSLNQLLNQMVKEGCTYAFMEASSHAIVQHRISGLTFAGAIFTNITHDHLDYHETFDSYIEAKKKLFDNLPSNAFALVNVDDKRGLVMLQNTKADKKTFALKTVCDFKGKVLSNTIHGLEMEVNNQQVWFKLIGDFNAYNLLGVYASAVLLGEDPQEVLTSLSDVQTAPGRFDQVMSETKITGIIDYAHTPDALENVLQTIKELKENKKVITVVGCGGNRDAAKRPIMADIACRFSDKVILTSDNPRNEKPEDILFQMEKGVKPADKKKTETILDRKEAIHRAVELANPGDIILVAGKGHETYQEVQGVKHPFDDKKILAETFKEFKK